MSSARNSGTPDASIVDSVLAKRVIAILRASGPTTDSLSTTRSTTARPRGVRFQRRKSTTPMPMTMRMMKPHQLDTMSLMPMSSCVFHGSALPVSAKIDVTLGTTDTIRMRHDAGADARSSRSG